MGSCNGHWPLGQSLSGPFPHWGHLLGVLFYEGTRLFMDLNWGSPIFVNLQIESGGLSTPQQRTRAETPSRAEGTAAVAEEARIRRQLL